MTVKENLERMLQDAIALQRPASEIAEIKRQLAAFELPTLAQVREKQNAFIKGHQRVNVRTIAAVHLPFAEKPHFQARGSNDMGATWLTVMDDRTGEPAHFATAKDAMRAARQFFRLVRTERGEL